MLGVRLLLALLLACAVPLMVSCTGGGDPGDLTTVVDDPTQDPDYEAPGVPSNIILSATDPSPASIGIAGAGFQESVILTFQVVDVNNAPVTGSHVVNFEILHGGLNGGEKLNNSQATTAESLVTTVFNSGSQAGTVQVRASLATDPNMLVDVTVTVTGGLPSGNAFGLSFGPLNIGGLITNGLAQSVRTDISDYFSNPVAPNIQVNFQTDYASVTGTGTFTNTGETENASVFTGTITTGPPRPEDGFVLCEAQTIGGNHSKVLALAVDPRDENVIYAGTDGGGVFKTIDGGDSWDLVGSPLRDQGAEKVRNLTGTMVRDLVVDANNPEVIYAATENGVFASVNGGNTWMPFTERRRISGDNLGTTNGSGYDADGLSVQFFPFSFSSTGVRSRTHIYVDGIETSYWVPPSICGGGISGVYIFDDYGTLGAGKVVSADYDAGTDVPELIYALAVNPSASDFDVTLGHAKTIYAGTYGDGVWKTSDGGREWRKASTMAAGQGVTFARKILSLAINEAKPTEIFAGSDGEGLFKSVDAGATWTKLTGTLTRPINESEVRDIVLEPLASGALNIWIAGHNGIHYSNDGGATWQTPTQGVAATDPLNTDVRALVRDDIDGTLYAATYGDVLNRSEPHGGVYRSSNGGLNWGIVTDLGSSSGVHALDSLALFSKAGNDILVAGSEGRTVSVSTDSGAAWTAMNGNDPTNITNTLFATGEVLHSGQASISLLPLYATFHGYGAFGSIYNGELAQFYVRISDGNGNRLVAGTTIKISTDKGSGSEYDIELLDGTYGGTDYCVSWVNNEETEDFGKLSIEVSGDDYGDYKWSYSYFLHGAFSVPDSLELTMPASSSSVSGVIETSGGSDNHAYSVTAGTITAAGVYTYTNAGLASGGVVNATITVTDLVTGDVGIVPVTITKE